jgi:hypothetical protein
MLPLTPALSRKGRGGYIALMDSRRTWPLAGEGEIRYYAMIIEFTHNYIQDKPLQLTRRILFVIMPIPDWRLCEKNAAVYNGITDTY